MAQGTRSMPHLPPQLEERAPPLVKDANELDSPRAYRLHQVEQERAQTAAKRAYREAQQEAALAARRGAVAAAKREAQERARSAALRRKMKTDFFAARAERQRKEDQERLLLAEKRRRMELGEKEPNSDDSFSDDDDLPDIDAMKASGLAPSPPSMLDVALPSADGPLGPARLSPTPSAGGAGGLFAKKHRSRRGRAAAAPRFAQHVGGGVTVGGAGTHAPLPGVGAGSRAYDGIEDNLDVVLGGLVYRQQGSPVAQTPQHSSAVCRAETEAWHRREADRMRQARAERRAAEKELLDMLARENAAAAAAAKVDRAASRRGREQAAEARRQRGTSGGVVPASAIMLRREAEQALEREAAASRVAASRARARERLQSHGATAAGRVGPAVARLERQANELRTKRQLEEEKALADRRANAASQRRARTAATDARRATDVRRKKLAGQVKRANERYQAVGGIVGQEQARAVTAHSSVIEQAAKQARQGEAPWWSAFGVTLRAGGTDVAAAPKPEFGEESTSNEASRGDGLQQEGGRGTTAARPATRSLQLDAQVTVPGDPLARNTRMPVASKQHSKVSRLQSRPATSAAASAYRLPVARSIAPPPFHDTHRPPPLRWHTNQADHVAQGAENRNGATSADAIADERESLHSNGSEAHAASASAGAESKRTISRAPSRARKSLFTLPAELAGGAVGESPDDMLLTTLALSTDSKQSPPGALQERATRIVVGTEGSTRAAARAATSAATKGLPGAVLPSAEHAGTGQSPHAVEERARARERLQSRSPSERFGFGTLRGETDASNPRQSLWSASLQRQSMELERRRAKFPFDESSRRELSLVRPQSQRLSTPVKSKAADHSRVDINSFGMQAATNADRRAPPTASPRERAARRTPRQSLLLAQPAAMEAASQQQQQQYFDALRPWTGHVNT